MKLVGQVSKGKLTCDPPEAWPIAMREYEGKRITLEIEVARSTRSSAQNRRWWGLVVPLAQHCLNLKRPGLLPLNKEQVHALLVTAFAGSEVTELGTVPVATRTKNTEQFSIMDKQACLWLGEQGYVVPDGEAVDMQDGDAA